MRNSSSNYPDDPNLTGLNFSLGESHLCSKLGIFHLPNLNSEIVGTGLHT